ncbi:Cell division protein FtsP [Paenibacillus solanacearum]|uniref:Cell division protein FtsP n=1 Tax=Paenibacillus solanacearum TaxID=2048548 RepID=A0A916K628_9BACL|nr:multicopper oxidase family protein [Paenibacillus solanacearum]CAG7633125.1 Cell division protein FtsP [Paenibacillus solanacearum]
MYSIWMMTELGGLFLLFLCSCIAGVTVSRLVYSPQNGRLHRKAGKHMLWAVWLTLVAGAVAAVIGRMAYTLDTVFWYDRVYVHAPLFVIPALLILLLALPKLVRLRKAAKQAPQPEAAPEPLVRGFAADPGLIVPFQATALGALAAVYYVFVPPITFQWSHLIPAGLLATAVVALWTRHSLRQRHVSRTDKEVRLRPWLPVLGSAAVLGLLAAGGFVWFDWAKQGSLLPPRMDMMAGTADYGGGTALAHDHSGHMTAGSGSTSAKNVSVTQLTGPRTGIPDKTFTLTAEKKTVQLSSGKSVDAWTFNGQIPGPELRMKEGDLVEVTLINKDVEQGATIHWHGLDVPNAEDGVAGATQDAVMPGESHTYRFIAEQTGTFWYHSHQQSKEAVQKGLFGPLVVEPLTGADPKVKDVTVITHRWGNTLAVGASDKIERMSVAPGTPVRLRLINTDDWSRQQYALIGASFQVAAIDGTELHQPGTLQNTRLELTTGGRYDITFIMPNTPVFLSVGAKNNVGLFLSSDGAGSIPQAATDAWASFDPVAYGGQTATPFDADGPFDRQFTMILDNKLGFYNGSFESLYTINGEVFPNTPMFMVREGELVKTTIINRGAVDHPMHLHGHHMLVLSRNGKPVQGTWWSDTLDVLPGDTYEVAFRADNPGVWMDHCHNLTHAAVGMTMHLMYEGVSTPFAVGSDTRNHPE